jgi:hypothetical protein
MRQASTVAVALAAMAVLAPPTRAASPELPHSADAQCIGGANESSQGTNSRSDGPPPSETVALRADQEQLTWTFDASRETVVLPVVIEATPPLTGTPADEIQVTPAAIVLTRSDRSEVFPKNATHTPPKVSRHGERITFDVCVDPSGAVAGNYTGTVFVDGPANVSGTHLEISVSTRSKDLLIIGSLIAGVAVIGVLTLKGVSDYRKEIDGTERDFRWREALLYIWSPTEGRLFTSLFGVVTASLVVFGLYNSDHTWGDDWYSDIVALAGASITAVGAQGVLDGLRGTLTAK